MADYRPAPCRFDVVAIAASAGGLPALQTVLRRLPAWYPAAIVVLQHRMVRERDVLPDLLRGGIPAGGVGVVPAAAGARAARGVAHVIPPPADGRMLVLGGDGCFEPVSLDPSRLCQADSLFASVADHAGPRGIGVVLTGMLRDGSRGAAAIKRRGGRVLVQDPASAEFPSMPAATLATGCADFALPLDRLADALVALVAAPGAADLLRVPLPAWVNLAG